MTDHTLAELSRETGLTPRTIRYYIAQGLIPAPGREGRSTRYPESTLARLRIIVQLRDRNLSLAEIRTRLADMSDAETELFAGRLGGEWHAPRLSRSIEDAPEVYGRFELAVPTDQIDALEVPSDGLLRSELTPDEAVRFNRPGPIRAADSVGERSQWEHIRITGDIELHVRRPLSRRGNRIVDRLMTLARELAEEHPP